MKRIPLISEPFFEKKMYEEHDVLPILFNLS